MNPYAGLVDCLRCTWLTGKTRPMEYRKEQLEGLSRFLDERKTDILHALHEDLRKVSVAAQLEVLEECQISSRSWEPHQLQNDVAQAGFGHH